MFRTRFVALVALGWASPALAQDSPPADDAERAREEAEMAAALQAQTASPAPATPTASSRGLSNLLNPAISANGLLLAGVSSRDEANAVEDRGDLETGLALQEVEVAFSAIVDPFIRADMVLAASTDEIGFEEAYVTTLELPRINIRGGLFKAALGRHNLLHTHAFPFVTGPLPWRALLGPEGLAAAGVSFDVLLPLPFFAEINAQLLDDHFGEPWAILSNETPDDPDTPEDESRDRRELHDLAYVGHLKTLFELSASSTLELGLSYVGGRNAFGKWTSLAGADLTLKWRPLSAERYTSLEWLAEVLWLDRPGAPGSDRTGGAQTHLRYQFAQRWWVQGRGAVLALPGPTDDRIWRGEALAGFVPSEFSAVRLLYGLEHPQRVSAPFVHDVFLQVIFSMGPHPAHAY